MMDKEEMRLKLQDGAEPNDLAMDHDEVKRRLQEGDEPIDLAIEKWERIKILLELDVDPHDIDYGSWSSCSLCVVFRYTGPALDGDHFSDRGCALCPLVVHNRRNGCKERYSPYHNFFVDETLENAQAMIDALKELKQ